MNVVRGLGVEAMRHKLMVLSLGAVALLGLTGCQASQASVGGQSPKSAVVRVIESEWHMNPSLASAPAGAVTFSVSNRGAIDHEMVILKTDLAGAALVQASGENKIDEGASGENMGEVQVAAGATGAGTFRLSPGHYVLICNIPAHYQAGMVTDFAVN